MGKVNQELLGIMGDSEGVKAVSHHECEAYV